MDPNDLDSDEKWAEYLATLPEPAQRLLKMADDADGANPINSGIPDTDVLFVPGYLRQFSFVKAKLEALREPLVALLKEYIKNPGFYEGEGLPFGKMAKEENISQLFPQPQHAETAVAMLVGLGLADTEPVPLVLWPIVFGNFDGPNVRLHLEGPAPVVYHNHDPNFN